MYYYYIIIIVISAVFVQYVLYMTYTLHTLYMRACLSGYTLQPRPRHCRRTRDGPNNKSLSKYLSYKLARQCSVRLVQFKIVLLYCFDVIILYGKYCLIYVYVML